MREEFLHSVFALAQTDISHLSLPNRGRTLRLVVPCNVEAYSIKVRFANFYATQPLTIGAASLALCDERGVLVPGTLMPVTVEGALSYQLPAEEELLSDMICFPIHAGQHFALSIYYPKEQSPAGGNWLGNLAQRSHPGNFSADLELGGPNLISRFARTVVSSDITVGITSVCEIIAACPSPGRVVGCFGDSITQQSNWTGPLEKLLHHHFPGEISLCNLGISGNRLLYGSPAGLNGLNGPAGQQRFIRDMLSLHGLTHAILELGTNDIGLPGGQAPAEEMIALPQYIEGMTMLADTLHAHDVKVYAATLAPRPIVSPYTEEREELRREMNHWLRSALCFDAVLDFDAVLRREDGAPGIKEGYVLPDGLHPSAYGGLWMAKSIDLSLFAGASSAADAAGTHE